MRTILIATTVAAAGLAGGAASAQVVTGGTGNTTVYHHPGANWQHRGTGWGGGFVAGQWYAGTRAPGGWAAYRRPHRGWRMPGYWRSPEYRIHNHAAIGLAPPPQGYGWSRYYDDAVLVDYDGRVYDSVSGIDWRRVDQPYPTGYGYPSQGYWNAPGGYDPCYGYRRGGSGIGGALVGGAIGAGIGAATGGLGSTLIGGGVGALAGQAIDRNRRQYDPRCDYPAPLPQPVPGGHYGGDYHQGGQGGYAYADEGYAYAQGGQGGVTYAPAQPVVQPIYGYGYGGGYIPGATATATVEFDQGPVTTTTTTTTTTEEWVSEPVRERVVYRTLVKKVPVQRQPVKRWRKPVSRCYDPCR